MRTVTLALSIISAGALLIGCSTTPDTAERRVDLTADVRAAIARAKLRDPSLDRFFDGAVGYAVFPRVGRAAIGVGGAYGRGQLFEHGVLVGYCTLTQATVGLALGGQAYTQLIFFETDAALQDFKSGNYAFAAQASAVALRSGAGANAKYAGGVAVFTMSEEGLMFEASIGGQKFNYEPIL